MTPTYQSTNSDFCLFHGDSMQILKGLKDKSFDMVFADPPYFLSGGGISFQNGNVVCVDKGDWDKARPLDEIDAFNLQWLTLCHQKLKDNGTIWVSGTYHNIFSVANCLNQLGFKILNVVTWQKTNPAPSITQRTLTYSSELIIWARKTKRGAHKYNADLMKNINNGKQLTDVWPMPAVEKWEKNCGKHPTQKPLGLLGRIIMATTNDGDWILDPFNGSGTTGIAANLLQRKYVGIEQDESFLNLTVRRYQELLDFAQREQYLSLLQKSIRTNFELTRIKNSLLISRVGSAEQLEWINQACIYNIPLKSTKLVNQLADIEYILLFDNRHHDRLHYYKVVKNIHPSILTKEDIAADARLHGGDYVPHRANTYLCIKLSTEDLQKQVRNMYIDTTRFMLPFEINDAFWLRPLSILDQILLPAK